MSFSRDNSATQVRTGKPGPRLRAFASAAVFLFGMCAGSLPDGLLPFGLLLLATTVVAGRGSWVWTSGCRRQLAWTAWLAFAVVALALLSAWQWDLELSEIEKRSRFLALPWAAFWACALLPERRWLWRGAVAGIWAALGIAMVQVATGAPRADGWNNAIVFADVVLGLAVLAVLLESDRPRLRLVTLAAAAVVLVLSGSRGALPGLALLVLVATWTAPWKTLTLRLTLLALVVAVAAGALLAVPKLASQVRLAELRQDVERLQEGDANSSTGARLERWQVAWTTLREHPLTGIGVGRFDQAMRQYDPDCHDGRASRCHLGHAHNDLAEWAATVGVPGALVLVSIYALPLAWFVRRQRLAPYPGFRGAAAAGSVLVLVFALCGLTQSMFAHQLTAGFYCVAVGLLAGLCARRAPMALCVRRP